MVKSWQNTILLVKPATVLRWHREGFRLMWKRKSKATKERKPRIGAQSIELIRDMATRNKTWGAERIRGELLKLGIHVAKRTIQRCMRAVRPPAPRTMRPHQGLAQHIPDSTARQTCNDASKVVAIPAHSGLHPDYSAAA